MNTPSLLYVYLPLPINEARFLRVGAPKTLSGSKGIGIGPTENLSTFFLLMVGLMSSVFALVGEFGAQGFIPFALFVIGFIINESAKRFFKAKAPPALLVSGLSIKTLSLIAGGTILVLTINYALNAVYNLSFLTPPLSTDAIAFSAQYNYFPIYLYTTLFAISEEYFFRAVLLYVAYNFQRRATIFAELFAVGASSFGWVIYHLWVYGSAPLVLAFVFFTGIVFGVITLRSRNILAATGIHIINNLVAAGLAILVITGSVV